MHNNCSGKHAGFLTLTKHLGAGPNYVDPDHPVQKAVKAAYEDQVSMRTFIDASDIAAMATFLCSDAARFMNGEIVSVDGHTETLRTEFPDDDRVSGVDF